MNYLKLKIYQKKLKTVFKIYILKKKFKSNKITIKICNKIKSKTIYSWYLFYILQIKNHEFNLKYIKSI